MEIAARVTKQPAERFDWMFTKKDTYRDPNMMPNLEALQRNVDMTQGPRLRQGELRRQEVLRPEPRRRGRQAAEVSLRRSSWLARLRRLLHLSPRAAGCRIWHLLMHFGCHPGRLAKASRSGTQVPRRSNTRARQGYPGSRVCSAPLRFASCCAAPGMTIERLRISAIALRLFLFSIVTACCAFAAAATAQTYPTKPMRIVVAFAPGGPADVMARLIGSRLAAILGQPFVIENRPGAGGTIGARAVAEAEADGYTLLLGNTSTLVIGPMVYRNVGYDPAKSFAPVAMLGTTSNLLVVHPSFPASSVQELIALAKASPGKLNYSSPGIGTPPHLIGEMLKLQDRHRHRARALQGRRPVAARRCWRAKCR